MAYTIISQNNTTTTLSDENGNVITVPARVTLATSTDYTIIKVNNNSVDLEDGDGKIIRGVPACVVLAGEGGGGGGSVDYSKTVQKSSTIPAASADNAGQVYLYTGDTNANFTQNYIYKNTASAELVGPAPDATEGEPGESMVFSLDGSVFNTYLLTKGITLTGQSVFYLCQEFDEQENPVYILQDSNYEEVETFGSLTVMATATGITWGGQDDFTGDFPYIAENITGFVVEPAYAWTRIDVQPAGATYTAGTGISIDANNEISVADPVLVNKATHPDSTVSILGNASTQYNSINIGFNSTVSKGFGTAVGNGSSVDTNEYGTAVGSGSRSTGRYGVALGATAYSSALGAIQLGKGTNTEASSLYCGIMTDNYSSVNYKLLSSDGTVPTARLTKVNTTITLAVADWSSNTQTVSISGITADGVVFVGPAPASQVDYTSAGIICSAQAAGTLTFTCDTVPSNNISVTVVML